MGNPYASYLDADAFLTDTSNTTVSNICLWTRNTLASLSVPGSANFNFSTVDYALYNVLGGVSAGRNVSMRSTNVRIPANHRNNWDTPDGKIYMGTGFFVRSTGSGSATFRPSMRTSGTQNFRLMAADGTFTPPPPPMSRDRIWLNMANAAGDYRQVLVGFSTDATAGVDRLYDAATFSDASYNPSIDIYSLIPSNATHFGIQGHGTFSSTDFFQLGYRAFAAGDYTISATADGIFASSQIYYIYDSSNNSYNTLSYTFTAAAGTNNTRLRVVFGPPTATLPSLITCLTLGSLWDSSYISGANGYPLHVQVRDTTTSNLYDFAGATNIFNMNHTGIEFGHTYQVRVANYTIGGVWQYGPWSTCTVTTPAGPPAIGVYNSAEICGKVITNTWTAIRGNITGWAGIAPTAYRFTITTGGIPHTITVSTHPSAVNLHSAFSPALPIAVSTTYSVTVDYQWGGNWINGTDVCTFTTGNPIFRMASGAVVSEPVAYPNPFADNFKINFNSESDTAVEVKVFDMLGRMIESHQTDAKSIGNLEIGNGYQSGIYNILVTQDGNVNSIRVIKQ